MAELSLEDMVRLVMVDRVEWMVTSPNVVDVENSSKRSASASRRDDEASEATSVGGKGDDDDGEFPMMMSFLNVRACHWSKKKYYEKCSVLV